jgi:uncharacterized membrane protein
MEAGNAMEKNRLEAFSDGVIAIIITIMVLELKVPHGDDFESLAKLWPVFISYVLSFLYVGIYWNNHHHMLQATESVSAGILWANLHLLFWLSLLPFTTGWMGENHFTRGPIMLYGFNLLACGFAYTVLQLRISAHHGPDHPFAQVIGRDLKGKASLALYLIGIAVAALTRPWIGFVIFTAVAIIWLIPDRRMEKVVNRSGK